MDKVQTCTLIHVCNCANRRVRTRCIVIGEPRGHEGIRFISAPTGDHVSVVLPTVPLVEAPASMLVGTRYLHQSRCHGPR